MQIRAVRNDLQKRCKIMCMNVICWLFSGPAGHLPRCRHRSFPVRNTMDKRNAFCNQPHLFFGNQKHRQVFHTGLR